MRGRGLKFVGSTGRSTKSRVAPHAGAWIEMIGAGTSLLGGIVAPHAGAWIEIQLQKLYERDARVAPHAGAWIEMVPFFSFSLWRHVAPHAGAWIEMILATSCRFWLMVAPHAGAWIEITDSRTIRARLLMSLPMRGRGLKSRFIYNGIVRRGCRSPCGGAWIEMLNTVLLLVCSMSLPMRGAWIEIFEDTCSADPRGKSLPMRERGLKFKCSRCCAALRGVAPHAGSVD